MLTYETASTKIGKTDSWQCNSLLCSSRSNIGTDRPAQSRGSMLQLQQWSVREGEPVAFLDKGGMSFGTPAAESTMTSRLMGLMGEHVDVPTLVPIQRGKWKCSNTGTSLLCRNGLLFPFHTHKKTPKQRVNEQNISFGFRMNASLSFSYKK